MINKKIKELIEYAKCHLDLVEEDAIYFENILLGEFKQTKPYEGEIDEKKIKELKVPDTIINPLEEYLKTDLGMDAGEASRFIVKIMGFITLKPSEVIKKFNSMDHVKALDYLYDLSIKNNYIMKTAVDKNILWEAHFPNNTIEISINLSKPEKNNKDIKKLLTAKTGDKYPQCLLCKENLGFYGNDNHPARQNIRTIPLTLANEKWYIQYSPYVYYDHHCIVFSERHSNMKINKKCLTALADFVEQFPNFFIGSNADLPIVGGSILNHEHFQGGAHILPMLKSKILRKFYKINEVDVSELDWYNSVVLLEGTRKENVIEVADLILNLWRDYSDESCDILAETTEKHNTITPVFRKVDDKYLCYLILRNNRTNDEHPDGIFHAHKEYHMIKKEGIGLIEAMGLFILPARLNRQFKEIEEVFGQSDEKIVEKYEDLKEFLPMIHDLKGGSLEDIRSYVNEVCKSILENTAVFKKDENGSNGFMNFMKEVEKAYEKR